MVLFFFVKYHLLSFQDLLIVLLHKNSTGNSITFITFNIVSLVFL